MNLLFSKLSELKALFEGSRELFIAAGAVSLVTFAGTLILLPFLLIRIPEDYFIGPRHAGAEAGRVERILFHTIKNLLGVVFLAMGFIMLFIPGQGLLTIMAGLWMLDIPGKRRMEIRLIRIHSVYKGIDLIRKKAGRPSLLLPEKPESGDKD